MNPAKSMQNALSTLYPAPPSLLGHRQGYAPWTDCKEQNKEFQELSSSHNTAAETESKTVTQRTVLLPALVLLGGTLTIGP